MIPLRYIHRRFSDDDPTPSSKLTISHGANPLRPNLTGDFEESYISYIDPANSYLSRFDCGYTHKPTWFTIKNRVIPRVLFKYCLSGSIICNGCEMVPGDALFVEPCAPLSSAPQGEGVEILWCAWEGDLMLRVIEQLRGFRVGELFHLGTELPLRALFEGAIYNPCYDLLDINRYASGFTEQLLAFLPAVRSADARPTGPLIKRAREIIDADYRTLTIETLAARLYVDPCHLARAFRRETGMTPKQYLTQVKLTYAEYYLTTTNTPIAQIAETIGYSSYTSFYIAFRRHYAIPPEEYRRMYRSE